MDLWTRLGRTGLDWQISGRFVGIRLLVREDDICACEASVRVRVRVRVCVKCVCALVRTAWASVWLRMPRCCFGALGRLAE